MGIGDPSGGIRGFRLFRISCVMSATSSPLVLRRASLISERVRDLLRVFFLIPYSVLHSTQGLERHPRM